MKWSILFVALLTTVAFSGCTSGDGNEVQDNSDLGELGELEATKDTGIIVGVVADPSLRPVANVQVWVDLPDGTMLETTSNDVGGFGFQGLEPGSYMVWGAKLGYATTSVNVEVVANVQDPDRAQLILPLNPSTKPRADTAAYDGFIECSFTLVTLSFAACGVTDGMPVNPFSNNQFLVRYNYSQVPDFIQSEMVWESTQSAGDEMSLSHTNLDATPQLRINASSGVSPLIVTIDRDMAIYHGLGLGNETTVRAFSDDNEATDHSPDEEIQEGYKNSGFWGTYNGSAAREGVQTADQTIEDEGFDLFGLGFNEPTAEDCIKYPTLFDACWGAGGLGMTFQQSYEIFTTTFFYAMPDDGWLYHIDGKAEFPE